MSITVFTILSAVLMNSFAIVKVSGPAGTEKITVSAFFDNSSLLCAISAPLGAKSVLILSAMIRGYPPSDKLAAMRLPILPTPIQPITLSIFSFPHIFLVICRLMTDWARRLLLINGLHCSDLLCAL